MNHTSIRTDSSSGFIHNDDREIQVSEWWSGDGVYVNITTPPKDGMMSTQLSFSIGIEDITDLSALLAAMDLIDLDEIKDMADEIKTKIASTNQRKMRF